ncbi:MAG: ROK family protein [Gemmatimonadaceae bacterium]
MRIGIDLGGTKIEGVALADSGEIIARHRVGTPREYGTTVDAVVALVCTIEQMSGESGPVGIGIPGSVSLATGLVKNANSVWLIGKPLPADLEASLGRPVRIMNDANCFALSEAADGAGAGAHVVFGVILGTGVGGGIVVGGQALVGPNLVAGEWGHNPLPWATPNELPGSPCFCGKNGCIETWLAGPAFERDHQRVTGVALPAPEIVRRAQEGESDALATLSRYHERLGRALGSLINVLDPDVIVLGGGMSNVPGLAAAVTEELPKHVFSDSVSTRVVRNAHGDSSGVRGAAWLWPLADGTPRLRAD